MKMIPKSFMCFLGSFGFLAAIERPADEKEDKVPSLLSQPQGGILKKDQKAEKSEVIEGVAYLGVGGRPASKALLMHLNLESALLLSSIDPTSPAGLAGLKENDLLVEVAGSKLTNQDSLREIIISRKPGSEVMLKLIRGGEVLHQKVILGASRFREGVSPRQIFPGQAADLNRLLEGRLGDAFGAFGNENFPQQLMDHLDEVLGDRGAKFQQFHLDLGADFFNRSGSGVDSTRTQSLRLIGEEGAIELKTQNGQRELEIWDENEKLLFKGPYNSEADKEAIPEEYRGRVERLDIGKNSSFQFRFNGKDPFDKLGKKKDN